MLDVPRGQLFIGGAVDPSSGARTEALTLVDSSRLTTHGVIVGMTGSGKTGLGIVLLEEALLAGIPTLIIDPKGDMGNLLLQFPELRSEDFRPWIDEAAARREGKTPEAFAEAVAAEWKGGLESWQLGPERMRELGEAAELTLYTPGSSAGTPIGLLGSPVSTKSDDLESVRDEIEAYVSGLLALAGIDADPLSSPEHVLLATLLENAWRQGRTLDLAALLLELQEPPVRKLGVFDVDRFFPKKERNKLATKLNALLASPSFSEWLEGPPLDIGAMLYTADGKPRSAILYLQHLSDAERMLVVTLVLSKVVTWMRNQPGTSGLRALVYMDEVFGYAPPTAAPPSKKPILTLLKQARAFGVGLVLATQNPVDLDYKALSNAGTWLIGRLQTDRDRQRIVDGMSSALGLDDATDLGKQVAGLGKRQWFLHQVGSTPTVFASRWAMSYLRGPLTREEVKRLAKARAEPPAPAKSPAPEPPKPAPAPSAEPAGAAPAPQPAPPAAPPPPAAPAQGYGAQQYPQTPAPQYPQQYPPQYAGQQYPPQQYPQYAQQYPQYAQQYPQYAQQYPQYPQPGYPAYYAQPYYPSPHAPSGYGAPQAPPPAAPVSPPPAVPAQTAPRSVPTTEPMVVYPTTSSVAPPPIAPGVAVRFADPSAPWLPAVGAMPSGMRLAPALVATVELTFDEKNLGLHHVEAYEAVLFPLGPSFEQTRVCAVDHDPRDFRAEPPSGRPFLECPAPLSDTSYFEHTRTALRDHLLASRSLDVFRNRALGICSRPGEDRPSFELRCQHEADQRGDAEAEKLRARYEGRISKVRDAIVTAELAASERRATASANQNQTFIQGAGVLLGMFMGGRSGVRGLASVASRHAGQARHGDRVQIADEKLRTKQAALAELEAELGREIQDIASTWARAQADIEPVRVPLEKSDVRVTELFVAWIPVA
ncbi:MAG: DUF87 domain-containing protein [Polyangiaceae bacterium]